MEKKEKGKLYLRATIHIHREGKKTPSSVLEEQDSIVLSISQLFCYKYFSSCPLACNTTKIKLFHIICEVLEKKSISKTDFAICQVRFYRLIYLYRGKNMLNYTARPLTLPVC